MKIVRSIGILASSLLAGVTMVDTAILGTLHVDPQLAGLE